MPRNDSSPGSVPGARDALAIEELRQLRDLVDQADLALWEWDLRTGRVRYSDAWKRQLGCTDLALREDIAEWETRIDVPDRERVREELRTFIEQPQHPQHPQPNWRTELRVRHADGSCRDVLMQLSLVLDANAAPARVIACQRDLSEHKRLERALRERTPPRLAELEQSERALHEQKSRMQLLLDAVPHMIALMDLQGGVGYANLTWREFYGDDFRSVTHAKRMAAIHPDDRAGAVALQRAVWAELERPADPRQPTKFGPAMMRLADTHASYRWFSIQSSIVRDDAGRPTFIVATATDVHALKRSEDSLAEAQARLQAALRVGGIGLLVWEGRERRVHWDDSLLCVIGRTREELEALDPQGILDLVHPDDRQQVHAAGLRALKSGEALELECRVVRRDGTLVSLAVKGSTEKPEALGPARMTVAVVDVTQRKQLEADVLQAQKMEAIGQLAGGIAHDFNNLLTVILGQLSLLQLERDLPAAVLEALQDIDEAAKRAAELTRQLLTFARRQLLHRHAVDLNEAVADTLKLLRRIVGESVTLELVPASTPVIARVDTTMLSQLLLNLTVNARDAMGGGGLCTIRTSVEDLSEAACARIAGAKPGRWACITVSDAGCGIAPEILPHVFEPFFTTKGLGHGTGLGLSTVYGILKQHGGFVHLESELGRGTVFRAYLPWESPDTTHVTHPVIGSQRASAARANVLLVEDEPAVRSVTHAVLQQAGHRVSVAENAQDALRVWHAQGGDFDLLLTDMTMPGGMTGLELIAALRADKPGLKAILCSGYSLDLALSESGGGVDDVALLQKPWTPASLLRSVTDVLGQR